MGKGRAVAIELDDVVRRELTALTRKHGAPQALAERARIVLAAAGGLKNKEIASKLGICTHTVGTWRNRFAERGMDGLYDEPATRRTRRDWRRRNLEHDPQNVGDATKGWHTLEPQEHG
jgi:hypothetical protein